jgi:cellulose synthase/poly-beta-1,6-N-acetylglucosamine synthase-like glycosyltransferase
MATYLPNLLGIILLVATLPVVIELAVLTFAFLLPEATADSAAVARSSPLRLVVIVPAHNESAMIGQCVESLRLSSAGSATRVVTIAHNCGDDTAQNAARAGSEVVVYDDPGAVGKGFALRRGFDHALSLGAEAVLVVDADSMVSGNLVTRVAEALGAGVDAVQCRYEMNVNQSRPITRLNSLAFRAFNLVRAGGRDRLGLSTGILGNGFAVRRQVLEAIPYSALSVVEDLEYHLQLVSASKKVVFVRDAVVSSCATGSNQGDLTQRSRWEGGRASVARRWLLPLTLKMMSGRPRLLEPILDLACLPIGYAALCLLIGVCTPVGWLQMYSTLAIAMLAVHVLVAAWSGPSFADDLGILARVPSYLLWKLRILPSLLRNSTSDAAWVRTERDAPAGVAVFDRAASSLDTRHGR